MISEWPFMQRFMWWKHRKLTLDETHAISVDFLHEFGVEPHAIFNGGEVYVLFREFINRYGRVEK